MFKRRHTVSVVYQSSVRDVLQACMCVDWSSWSAKSHTWMSSTCSGNEPYLVTWSTHGLFDPPVIPMTLTVSVVRPTSNNYTKPSETVSFHLSATTPESVTYLVNFNDSRSASGSLSPVVREFVKKLHICNCLIQYSRPKKPFKLNT